MLESREGVQQYVESTEFHMPWYRHLTAETECDVVQILESVLDNEKRTIQSFDMSGEVELFLRIGQAGLERLLKHKNLQDITRAVFDNCKPN